MSEQSITQNIKTVKPFDRQGHFTVIDNVILDHIMPNVKPNAWKVLCFIIRKTEGWHKDEDQLSITQIMDGTGIKNRNTVSKAITELEGKNYILVHRPNDQKTPNTYSLNRGFELVQKSYQAKDEASTEIVPELVQKSYPQKKVFKQTNNIAGKPADQPKDKKSICQKPKTRLMNKFVSMTGLSIPTNKQEKSFWWSKIGVIYDAAGKDAALGESLIVQAIKELRQAEMSIAGPGSLVKTVNALLEKRNRQAKPTNGQAVEYVEVAPPEHRPKEMQVDEGWLTEQLAKARGIQNDN